MGETQKNQNNISNLNINQNITIEPSQNPDKEDNIFTFLTELIVAQNKVIYETNKNINVLKETIDNLSKIVKDKKFRLSIIISILSACLGTFVGIMVPIIIKSI